ncbi:hypothetical protein Tco_0530748 [Tanacetum coccineum]
MVGADKQTGSTVVLGGHKLVDISLALDGVIRGGLDISDGMLSDFAGEVWEQNRVLAGFGIGGRKVYTSWAVTEGG